jgi:hypothetical protein
MTAAPVGESLTQAIAAGDRDALLRLLAPTLDFKAVTPGRLWEAGTATEVADVILGTWFGGARRIESVEVVECETVADLERARYRFRATTPDGESVVEQQAYLQVDDGGVTALRIVCSGFRRVG